MRTWLQNVYNSLTLRDKILILFVLIIVSVLMVLGYFATNISSGIIIDKTEKSTVRELELIDSNLFTLLSGIEDYSKVVATNDRVQELLGQLMNKLEAEGGQSEGQIDVIGMRPEMYSAVSPIISPNTPIFAISVFLNNQAVYSDSMIDSTGILSIIGEEFLESAHKLQKPVWSDLMSLTLNDGRRENVFAVAKLVIDLNKGNTIGVVILFIDEKKIARMFSDNKSDQNSRQYILNSSGRIISSENKADLNQPILEILNIDEEQYHKLQRDNKIVLERNEGAYLLSLQEANKNDWNIISVVSMEEIRTDNSRIQRFILTVGAICLVFAIIFSFYISNTVTQPIQKLAKIMIQVKKGDMNIRADHANNQEIGLLTHGFNSLMNKVENLLDDVVNEQKLKQEYELKLIQSQMNPHFLYNSLETIISLNKLERYEEAIQVTRTLADFYRRSLSKGRDTITVNEEITIIHNYLKIQKQRYSNYMEFSIDVSEDILDYAVPKLTLQPLVENSIYHGLKFKGNRGRLDIQGYRVQDNIVLIVSDDGVGMPEEKIAALLRDRVDSGNRDSFGFRSVDRRIKLLFGSEYGLSLESELGQFTRVTVTIPALKMEG
ncbi:cache domain-containing sensor histidine kinase [Paenibacillus agaridevorans]|uniref:cache domain-containing sensor histidine kinase n=1 Tax=Paenibacillus agaridevorans TaxID=171404 RepID=UPI001BE483FF|nr:sensor histidine kinase [Paenibacillus agaridevorans]